MLGFGETSRMCYDYSSELIPTNKLETAIAFPLPARQEIAAGNPKLDPNPILHM